MKDFHELKVRQKGRRPTGVSKGASRQVCLDPWEPGTPLFQTSKVAD
jgi:hypothetical protein